MRKYVVWHHLEVEGELENMYVFIYMIKFIQPEQQILLKGQNLKTLAFD